MLAVLQIYFLLVLLLVKSFLFAACFRCFRNALLVYRFLLGLCFLGYYIFFVPAYQVWRRVVSASFVRKVLCCCYCLWLIFDLIFFFVIPCLLSL